MATVYISNANELYNLMILPIPVIDNIVITGDIDMGNLVCSSIQDFQGSFNGQGYTVKINKVSQMYVGFFNSINNPSGNIENINIIYNVSTINNSGFVFNVKNAIINNCNLIFTQPLTINKIGSEITNDIGGYIGHGEGLTINNSSAIFTNTVLYEAGDAEYVGGFVGDLVNSTINQCVVLYQKDTSFKSGDYSGGFIGNKDSPVMGGNTFTNCYAILNNFYFNGNFANNHFTYTIGDSINGQSTVELSPFSFFASGQLNNFSWISQLVNVIITSKDWVIPFDLNTVYTINTAYSTSMKNWVINYTLINNNISSVSSTYGVIAKNNLVFGFSNLDANTPVKFVNPNVNLENGVYYIKENFGTLLVNGEQVYYQSDSTKNIVYLNNIPFSVGQVYKVSGKYIIKVLGTGSAAIEVELPKTPFWVWILVAIGILIVVIIILYFAIKFNKKPDYYYEYLKY